MPDVGVYVNDDHVQHLLARLAEAEETVRAIRHGEVDALVVNGPQGEQIYTLKGADHAYQVMVEEMEEGAVTLGNDGTILYCNPRFAEILCLPDSRLLAAPIRNFIPPDSRPAFDALFARGSRERAHGEIEFYTSDGARVPVSIALGALPDSEVAATCLVATDLTRRKRAEEAVRQLNEELESKVAARTAELQAMVKELEVFTTMVSHDLRIPLTVIHGHAGLLREKCQALPQHPDFMPHLEAIDRAVKRFDLMISDLVDAARLERNLYQLRLQEIDLNAFLRGLLEHGAMMLSPELLRLDLPDALPAVRADTDRLEQIIMNLLSNALKYSEPDHPVAVAVYRQDDRAVLSVTDQGIGIHPNDLPFIFDRFYRANGKRKAEGIGLGLYITRLLVEAHGERIWVESRPGEGSIFSFTLPLVVKQ